MNYFMKVEHAKTCYQLADLSPCVKAKYGCVIVDPEGIIVGRGWNRSPNPSFSDCKNLCAGGIRKGVASGTCIEACYAVHAEQWALLQAGDRAKGATLFVTGYGSDGERRLDDPFSENVAMRGFYCSMCARLIWAAGIKEVICDSVNGLITYSLDDIWRDAYAVGSGK